MGCVLPAGSRVHILHPTTHIHTPRSTQTDPVISVEIAAKHSKAIVVKMEHTGSVENPYPSLEKRSTNGFLANSRENKDRPNTHRRDR